MNTVQPESMPWKFSITLLGVNGRAAQRYPLWRVMHLKNIGANVLFITQNEDSVLHCNVNRDCVYFMIVSQPGLCFNRECPACPHISPRSRSGLLSTYRE